MASTSTITFIFSFIFPLLFLPTPAYSESEILLQFKASIDDPTNALSDWSNKTSIHHCNWTGISCSPFLVTSINLQSFNLSGEISSSICSLSNLSHLNLAHNLFNSPIPLHLSECTSLITLNLSTNLIWGTIPEQIPQFRTLQVLDLSNNHIEGKIPETIGLLGHLRVLNLGTNLLSGTVPVGFGNFTNLVVLDLSHNPFLVSEIPADIGGLSNLQELVLQSSNFYGELGTDFFKGLMSLKILDLSQNNLTGNLPQIGFSLPNLVSFDVSQNNLSGPFPNGVCKAKLLTLSLHTNSYTGSIPNQFISGCVSLERFEVQNNGYSLDFPSLLWSLPKIKFIRGENNRFSGKIPDSIAEAPQLEHVQIDNNRFSSRFPPGVGKVATLYRFSASSNALYGELPPNFCDSPVMSIFNVSHNFLTGRIPAVRKCKKLVSLSLGDNRFIGSIPESLGDLPVLTYLDLSKNNLTGSIPEDLQNLKLALFDISFNNLSGKVSSLLISGIPISYLQGNPGLCGPGLPHSCLNDESKRNVKWVFALVVTSLTLVVLVIALGYHLMRSHHLKGWKMVLFYPLRVTKDDLVTAMGEKAARGSGNLSVFDLQSGDRIIVKKVQNICPKSTEVLKKEVKKITRIQHKNVAKIFGFCYYDNVILVMYEYHSNGSLGDLIGKPGFNMPWSVRLRIAIGIAQGLEHLHKDDVTHGNLKSSKVYLDADIQPKITDFATITASEFESSCYLAPENRCSKESDVYSFGVVLLELLTGREAEKRELGDTYVNVVQWVKRRINIADGATKVLDPNISTCSGEALEIALQCTCVVPENRPTMCEVVEALQRMETDLPNL